MLRKRVCVWSYQMCSLVCVRVCLCVHVHYYSQCSSAAQFPIKKESDGQRRFWMATQHILCSVQSENEKWQVKRERILSWTKNVVECVVIWHANAQCLRQHSMYKSNSDIHNSCRVNSTALNLSFVIIFAVSCHQSPHVTYSVTRSISASHQFTTHMHDSDTGFASTTYTVSINFRSIVQTFQF